MNKDGKSTAKYDTPEAKLALGIMITAGVIIVAIIIFLAQGISEVRSSFDKTDAEQAAKASQEAAQPPQPPAVTTYGVDISKTVNGIRIVNNEDTTLADCNVALNAGGLLNGGYDTEVTIYSKGDVFIPWISLTKDAERFDYSKYAVENVSVSNCNDDQRFSFFEPK